MRVHPGCGLVYLDGYVNVDVEESGAQLASNRPDLAEKWRTTEDAYYAKHEHITRDKLDCGFMHDHSDAVCDVYGTWDALPFEDGTVDEVLSRQCWEHLSQREARTAMLEARRVLKIGGILRLDVPNVDESLMQFGEAYLKRAVNAAETQDEENGDGEHDDVYFCLRHLLGSRKNSGAYHLMGWNQRTLRSFVEWHGFEFIEEEPNIHFYPAFCMKWRKVPDGTHDRPRVVRPWKAAWEYAGDPLGTPVVVPDDWLCIEIGPGNNPWPRANCYLDINPEHLDKISQDKDKVVADVMQLPEFIYKDRKVDFCLISHCLEHVEDPVKSAAEISRVAKSGLVICPHPLKEGLWASLYEEDHRWFVFPASESDALRFMRIDNDRLNAIRNRDVSAIMHQLLRLGSKRLPEYEELRAWFHRTEPWFDTIHRFGEEGLKVEVIG